MFYVSLENGYRSCTHLGRFVPKWLFFIFWCCCMWYFLFSNSKCSLLIYRNTTNFCILVSWECAKHMICSRNFFGRFFLDFSMRYVDCMISDIGRYEVKLKKLLFLYQKNKNWELFGVRCPLGYSSRHFQCTLEILV